MSTVETHNESNVSTSSSSSSSSSSKQDDIHPTTVDDDGFENQNEDGNDSSNFPINGSSDYPINDSSNSPINDEDNNKYQNHPKQESPPDYMNRETDSSTRDAERSGAKESTGVLTSSGASESPGDGIVSPSTDDDLTEALDPMSNSDLAASKTLTPSASVPSVPDTSASVPSASVPSVPDTSVSVPSASIPSASTPSAVDKDASVPPTPIPSASLPSASLPSASVPSASVPSASEPSEDGLAAMDAISAKRPNAGVASPSTHISQWKVSSSPSKLVSPPTTASQSSTSSIPELPILSPLSRSPPLSSPLQRSPLDPPQHSSPPPQCPSPPSPSPLPHHPPSRPTSPSHPFRSTSLESFRQLQPAPSASELLLLATLKDAGDAGLSGDGGRAAAGATAAPGKDYESLDYDRNYNSPYEKVVENTQKHATRNEFIRWIVTFAIGVATGIVALFIDVIVKQLNKLKFSTVEASVLRCSTGGCLVVPLLLLLAFNVVFVIVAALFVYAEPVAAGSGIPEIKCYLNGVKVPRVVRLKTLVCKACGVLFSVAGGLFCGKEGPMIHSGAVIGCGMPQFQSVTFRAIDFNFPFFRTDRDKRDFVSGGAAAGVAAAFGAPVGGVLFSLEEGSSFWNQALTWRTFFCAMSATFTLNFFLSGIEGGVWGAFNQPGLLSFGEFVCPTAQPDCRLWNFYDLALFSLMGVGGGLLGAIFNTLNGDLTRWRQRTVHRRHKSVRVAEAALVALVTSTLTFVAAMGLGECKELPANATSAEALSVRTFFCPSGSYNDMATLFFNPQEVAIRQLFHQQGIFSVPSLGTFFILFFLLACWTYGASVPSGLFVPALLCGAAYGRLVGNLLSLLGYRRLYHGTFALMGAAAFLGGVARMTISLTVILIESTNNIVYGLPIMITLMVAKWIGDFFNEGIYDKHINIKGVPFLEWEPPTSAHRLQAKDVMDVDLVYVYPHSKVQSLVDILKTSGHNAFPVVTRLPRKKRNLQQQHRPEKDDDHLLLQHRNDHHLLLQHGDSALRFDEALEASVEAATLRRRRFEEKEEEEEEEEEFLVSNNFRFRAKSVVTRRREMKTRMGIMRRAAAAEAEAAAALSGTEAAAATSGGERPRLVMRLDEDEDDYSYSINISDVNSGGDNFASNNINGDDITSNNIIPRSFRESPSRLEILKRLREGSEASAVGGGTSQIRPPESTIHSASADDTSAPLTFHGLILRSELVTLLERGVYYAPEEGAESQWRLDYAEMTAKYPRYPSIHDVSVPAWAKSRVVDLTPYINPCPYTVPANMPVSQVFNLFRSMGLRHLVVINALGDTVGVITRHNLTHKSLEECWRKMKTRREVEEEMEGGRERW